MPAMNINANTYVIAIDATSKSATLNNDDANNVGLVLYNDSTTAVAVFSGGGAAAPTASFPASATVPVGCTVIGPGATYTLLKNAGDKFISAIQAVAGVGNLYIKASQGE